MTPITHELIRASAGTGKTYQLVNRYLRLLFATGEPEKIIALTFTRKAAGEFFEKIFRRLAEAAESEARAAQLGRELGHPVSMVSCRGYLRLLLERLHRLQLSTYDSFFTRVVQTFPFELGLTAAPALLDDDQQDQAIQRAQRALSRRTASDAQFLTDFWHACKRASMGAELKSVTEIVADFIRANHTLFFDAAEAARWGGTQAIWSAGCPWACGDVDLAVEGRQLKAALAWDRLAPKTAEYWREFILALETWRPPLELPKRIAYFLEKLLPRYTQLDSGFTELELNKKKQVLSVEQGAILRRIVQHLFWCVLRPRLEATQGLYDLVRLFEEIYGREVRLMGQLTLEDATRLLAGGPTHGKGLADESLRDQLGYRLDGAFDHWLLDEFQDTSRVQWRAVSELIDEILQDPEGRRTFFAVGDTKQSLYGWRGSDDRLFDRVLNRYRSALTVRALNRSFRSVPDVLALPNAIFGNTTLLADLFTPELAQRWASMWCEHEAADALKDVPGHACLLHAPVEDATRFSTVLSLLQTLGPLEKGLSVAILTQKNDTADALVEYLRAHGGPPCSLAANVTPGSDNVPAAGLQSFLTLAAHAGDTLAWQHLRMSPVGPLLESRYGDAATLSAALLELWSQRGLTGLVDAWIECCLPILDTNDAFNRGRLEQCRNAAVTLEERGELDIDAFLRHLGSLSLREHDTPGQVAVMTIYKAKGLDWDIVLLPDLEGSTLMERRSGLEVQRDEAGDIEWILDMPTSSLAQFDAALGARLTAAREDAAFENLCVLYVALTRAKRGLYVITHPAKGTSKNYHRLIDDALSAEPRPREIAGRTFTCAWEQGDCGWLVDLAARKAEPTPKAGKPTPLPPAPGHAADATSPGDALPAAERITAVAPRPLQPSADRPRRVRGSTLFASHARQRDVGTAVHAALSRVEWLSGSDRATNAATVARLAQDLDHETASVLRSVLESEDTGQAFLKPQGAVDLWREKAFELLLDDRWVSGRFDRVVVTRDAGGRATDAAVIDIKVHGSCLSEADLREHHQAQMRTYRAAAARLLGLAEKRITVLLLVVETSPGTGPRLVVV